MTLSPAEILRLQASVTAGGATFWRRIATLLAVVAGALALIAYQSVLAHDARTGGILFLDLLAAICTGGAIAGFLARTWWLMMLCGTAALAVIIEISAILPLL